MNDNQPPSWIAHCLGALFWLVYAYAALSAVLTLIWPMGVDQGIFAWVADVIRSGGSPYVDAWEQKGPASFLPYALAQTLFGRGIWGIRVIDLVLLGAALAIAARAVYKTHGALPAQGVALWFLFIYIGVGYWDTAQPDGWAAMLLLIAWALASSISRSTAALVIAAMLVGLASLFKPLYLLLLLPFLIVEFLAAGASNRERVAVAGLMLGASLIPVLCGMIWLGISGGLGEFLSIQFGFNPVVHLEFHGFDQKQALPELFAFFVAPKNLAVLILAGFSIVGMRTSEQETRTVIGLVVMLAIAIAIVIVQRRYFGYHWLPVYAPLLLLAARGLAEIRRRWSEPIAAIALLVAILIIQPGIDRRGLSAVFAGTQGIQNYQDSFGRFGPIDFSVGGARKAAEYLQANTRPDESIQIWGFEARVNYLANRPAASRFGFNYPLVVSAGTRFEQPYRDEFVSAVAENRPIYFVVVDSDQNWLMQKTSAQYLDDFTELREYLEQSYALETRIERFSIWRRKN